MTLTKIHGILLPKIVNDLRNVYGTKSKYFCGEIIKRKKYDGSFLIYLGQYYLTSGSKESALLECLVSSQIIGKKQICLWKDQKIFLVEELFNS